MTYYLAKSEKVVCPHCGKHLVKHIIKDGARYHATSWDSYGKHCSEPNCEVNHRCPKQAREVVG